MIRLLQQNGRYDVRLACLNSEGVLRTEAESLAESIPAYPLTSFYNLNAFKQLRRFARFLSEHRIAVVQTHDFYTNVFGMIGAAMAGVPVRIAARRETGGVRTRLQKLAEHGAYRLAHSIVANASVVRDELVKEGIAASKVEVIYNGIDLERFQRCAKSPRHALLQSLGLANEGWRYVTIVANMRHPVKDHATFLRAARLVATAVPDAAFLLAGEGELEDSLRAFADQLGLTRRAIFLGRCVQIGELLNVSDVCVLSSRAEGFPNAVLEYMAAGRPVVSTAVGGVREAVMEGESGYIVPVGDEQQLADRIVALLSNQALASAFGRRGRQLVGERFSCQAQLARLETLYNRLLANAKTSDRLKYVSHSSQVTAAGERTTDRTSGREV